MTHLTNNNLLIIESMNHIECSLVADEVIIKKKKKFFMSYTLTHDYLCIS